LALSDIGARVGFKRVSIGIAALKQLCRAVDWLNISLFAH
jgi:hypothetical protein